MRMRAGEKVTVRPFYVATCMYIYAYDKHREALYFEASQSTLYNCIITSTS